MMELLDLSHNDDTVSIARKCNINFKRMWITIKNMTNNQTRNERDETSNFINNVISSLVNTTIPNEVASQLNSADIPGQVSNEVTAQISSADIPGQIGDALDSALAVEMTNTLSDFFVEDGCTVTACNAMRWGDMAFIRFSYRLNSALTVPSNGDITDVTLGTLKIGWRPFDITNVILDQTKIIIGDVDINGAVKARSANSRGSSYTIDANAVLYASMMLMIGLQ